MNSILGNIMAALLMIGQVSAITTPPSGAITVSKAGGGGKYMTIQAAINSLADTGAVTIFIYPGTYTEMVYITRTGPLTIYGSAASETTYTGNTVLLTNNVSAVAIGADDLSAPLRVHKSNFTLINVNVQNTFNTGIGVAVSYYGTYIGSYGCQFLAYQDTLLTETGEHYFENTYIEGAVDYIFGQYSKAYFQSVILASIGHGYVTANGRASSTDTGGYVFNGCTVTASSKAVSGTVGKVYLGRPWGAYARVIYMYSDLTDVLNLAGWYEWTVGVYPSHASFFEYNNSGAGAWNSQRANFSQEISATVANEYSLANFFSSTSWILSL
ncbi:hypothetical protein HK100_007157 [Physocladia obscura]|uniref:Pectinesterase n=1 Tax=Physocladia obscura TaxID=109957 RepID=A0AAD5XEZ6_9FUNG|nr:hypothetical protein HK100_007157 [Physocladia obscura]